MNSKNPLKKKKTKTTTKDEVPEKDEKPSGGPYRKMEEAKKH